MNLAKACGSIISQLTHLVNQLTEQDFVKPVASLGGSSIGQHLRHTLEFFICLEQGFSCGIINYDKREHDKLIETDKEMALATLNRIQMFVNNQQANASLVLEVGYDLNQDDVVTVETNYLRELTYNIEHAVHHMAIMKIGVREVAPYITLPREFGVAASTIRYQEASAGQ